MVSMFPGGDPGRSAPGWQGETLDVEIERVNYGGSLRFRWSLYHRARLIKTGMRRSRWAAAWAARFTAFCYQMFH
jgi:hypothetical protein